ncbi:MAG: DUF6972 family protein [Thainema sp.]
MQRDLTEYNLQEACNINLKICATVWGAHGVERAWVESCVYTGFARGYDRYGLFFAEAIGVRISPDGSTIPLFYGEVKINADNRYHPIPRSRPSEE